MKFLYEISFVEHFLNHYHGDQNGLLSRGHVIIGNGSKTTYFAPVDISIDIRDHTYTFFFISNRVAKGPTLEIAEKLSNS